MGSRRGSHYDADGYVDVIRKRICKRRGQRERELERERRERRERRECAVRYKLCVSFLLPPFILDLGSLLHIYCSKEEKIHAHTLALTINHDDNGATDGGNVDTERHDRLTVMSERYI